MSQIPLPLVYRSATGFGDYYQSPANHIAAAYLLRWPHWEAPCALLIGAKACGKTHLARVLQDHARGVWLDGAPDQWPVWPAARTCYIRDDADQALDLEALFHLFNRVQANGASLLLTMRNEPRDWAQALPDLASRLASVPHLRISPPDDALLGAVLVKRLRDRGLDIAPEVVEYLLRRMERSFTACATLAEQLDAAALQERKAVTISVARSVLTSDV